MATKLTLHKGDSAKYAGAVTADGLPVSLVDALVVFTVSETDGGASILQKSSTNPLEIDIYDSSGGKFYIYIGSGDTNITEKYYPYEIQITFVNGFVKTIEEDFFVIIE